MDEQRLAMQLYVMDMRSLEQIAVALDVSLQTIEQWALEGSWASIRDSASNNTLSGLSLSPRSSNGPQTASEDLLSEHEEILGLIFRQIKLCLHQMDQDDVNQKALRNRVEALRSIAEAVRGVIDTHRQVRGIRQNQPSIVVKDGEKGVQYRVVKPPVPTQ